eukprot:1069282-Rhodomonas_salina.1
MMLHLKSAIVPLPRELGLICRVRGVSQILLLSSRIQDAKSIPSIVNILGKASRNNVIISAGPALFFDDRYPAG